LKYIKSIFVVIFWI